MNASANSAIRLSQVSLGYAGDRLLSGLDLEFSRHRITTLAGPSGAGKSTLLRLLCRMNDRVAGFWARGRVEVLGQDIHGPGVDVYRLRRRVGLVFQKPCVFPGSVYANVCFGLKHHQPRQKKEFPELAERALRQAALWREVKDRLEAPARTLSQGQQQRLAIARTLALNPKILLLDEPTASLDPAATGALEDLALALKPLCTIVWVTHSREQAARIADVRITLPQGSRLLSGDSSPPAL
ncbi:MAG: phosphate ABC transporter ATP-binding protein [Nitrospinaceae bacterium]